MRKRHASTRLRARSRRRSYCAAPNPQQAQDPLRHPKPPSTSPWHPSNCPSLSRESVPSAEREKIWATDDRVKGFAGGGRGLVIIQGYAREHALLDIVRERLDRERLNLTLKRERLQGGAKCRRHRWVLSCRSVQESVVSIQYVVRLYQFRYLFELTHVEGCRKVG